MAQRARVLHVFCKQENLSSNPQHLCKSMGTVLIITVVGDRRTLEPQLNSKPCLREGRQRFTGKIAKVLSQS